MDLPMSVKQEDAVADRRRRMEEEKDRINIRRREEEGELEAVVDGT